jgi:hypothetical protein
MSRQEIGNVRAISAHRVMRADTGAKNLIVTDLVSGSNRVISATPTVSSTDGLWGDYAIHLQNGEIKKTNLQTGVVSTVLTVAQATGLTDATIARVLIHGDFLVWSWRTSDDLRQSVGWLNVKTGARGARMATIDLQYYDPGSVFGGYAAIFDYGTDSTSVVNMSNGATVATIQASRVQLGSSGAAWISDAREPKVTPLPDQHLRPRHEGNPFGPASFDLAAATSSPWVGEWVFTEPLTTCTVAIKNSSGSTVRTLACTPAWMALGEAVVSWDGKDAAGMPVPVGSYTWAVSAGDGDGAGVDTDGVSQTIAGSVAVTNGTPLDDRYVALAPQRLLDTRSGLGSSRGPVAAGQQVQVQVTGRGGVPSTGVGSVVLNVTAVGPQAAGFVTVYPTGSTRPNASNANYVKDGTVANQVILKVGTDGKVSIYTSAGSNLIVDVAGYYPPGSRFTGVAPARVLDTRSTVRIPAGGKVDVQVSGKAGVPSSGAVAAALNVTAVSPSAAGYLTVWPAGQTRPTASNVNYAKASTVAGLTLAKLGTDGKVSIYSAASSDVLVDVSGWLPATSDYLGLSPTRVMDTRSGLGAPKQPLPAGGSVSLQITGRGGVPGVGVKAVMLNVAEISAPAAGYVITYPSGSGKPTASTLNYGKSQTIANSVVVKVGADGKVVLYSSAGGNLIADVQGYITTGS